VLRAEQHASLLTLYSPTNPASTADELVYQLSITKAKLIITHPICLATARKAAKMHGLPENCIILIQNDKTSASGMPTLDELIKFGSSKPENYIAVRLKPGEAKTTIAFFCFSSGTTGELFFEP
jgi:4-coumarate--CoA ligase